MMVQMTRVYYSLHYSKLWDDRLERKKYVRKETWDSYENKNQQWKKIVCISPFYQEGSFLS